MRIFRLALATIGLATVMYVSAGAGRAQDAETLHLIVLGDMPYGKPVDVYPPFEALIDEINSRAPDLVVHIGDTKGGGQPCTDEILTDQFGYMNSVIAPLLYTPGDNEWTDCHKHDSPWDDPLERLDFVRSTYFAEPGTSLGQNPVVVQHQGDAGYPENARHRAGEIGIITAHIVGSNNNFEIRELSAVEEFFARSAASTLWLREGFAAFGAAEVIVVAIHADMFRDGAYLGASESWEQSSGFKDFGGALMDAAQAFGKPVLLVFGDSHKHRVFAPFPKRAPNIMAVETYGKRDMHAVEVIITPGEAAPFGFSTVWNPAQDQ